MRSVPYYDRVESDYDVDHEITAIVGVTKKMLADMKEATPTKKEYNQIAKAMIETILETL